MTVTAGPTNVDRRRSHHRARANCRQRRARRASSCPTSPAGTISKLFPPTSKWKPATSSAFKAPRLLRKLSRRKTRMCMSCRRSRFHFSIPTTANITRSRSPPCRWSSKPPAPRRCQRWPQPKIPRRKTRRRRTFCPSRKTSERSRQAGPPLVARPAFLVTQSVPVLAFLAAFIWRKRADNLANNPRLRRQRAVAQLVASGLNDLKKFAAANQPDEFFALLFRLLQEQLGERLDCPAIGHHRKCD